MNMSRKPAAWHLLIVVNVLFLCVLGFYRTSPAAPSNAKQPFANSVAQRQEIIEQLKEVNRQLRQQNALLQNGRLNVVITKQNEK